MCCLQERQLSLSVMYLSPLIPRFTFWLTVLKKLYVNFILLWIAFIFGRDEEEDQ